MATSEIHLNMSSPTADDEALAWAARRRQQMWRARMLPAIGVAGLLFTWWAVVAGFHVKPFIAPSPMLVLETFVSKRDVLIQNLLPTAIEASLGFLLGNLAAILLATVFVHNKTLRDIFYPVAVMINSIPVVAKAPILVLIMGNGLEPKITIAATNSVTRLAYGAPPMTWRACRTVASFAMAASVAAIAQERAVKSAPAKPGQISRGHRSNAGSTPK